MTTSTGSRSIEDYIKALPSIPISKILCDHPTLKGNKLTQFLTICDSSLTRWYWTEVQEKYPDLTGSDLFDKYELHVKDFNALRETMITGFAEKGSMLSLMNRDDFWQIVKQAKASQASGRDVIFMHGNKDTNFLKITTANNGSVSIPALDLDIDVSPTASQSARQTGLVFKSFPTFTELKHASKVLEVFLKSTKMSSMSLDHANTRTSCAKLTSHIDRKIQLGYWLHVDAELSRRVGTDEYLLEHKEILDLLREELDLAMSNLCPRLHQYLKGKDTSDVTLALRNLDSSDIWVNAIWDGEKERLFFTTVASTGGKILLNNPAVTWNFQITEGHDQTAKSRFPGGALEIAISNALDDHLPASMLRID